MSRARIDDNTVRFVLDGETIELRDVAPTRTVLQFLREDLYRTGTKEGCAEGDCGACTVVIAEIDRADDGLALRAVNACIQFLPTLDGKELITVESLTGPGGKLHPVQQAMVECHGSQCGFCTPGFVMSLFALYKTNSEPTRVEIDDALAGNLCRCTGYRPIIAAARSMYDLGAAADDWMRQPVNGPADTGPRVERLRSLSRDKDLELHNRSGHFYAPSSSGALAELLAKSPDATILAGGTDVGLWVTKQHRELKTIIYTGRVAELSDIEVTSRYIEIGSAVTLTDAMHVIVKRYPGLDEVFRRFASPPIRNAGTLGGNIANGSPIGDSMPALIAAGTSLILRSADGTREVALDNFYHDYRVNDLRPGEFIEVIRIPLPGKNTILRSHKLSKRFDQDISAVCTAYRLELDGDRVQSFRMACGGLAATVMRARRCEAAITASCWNEETVENAARALAEDFTPITDMRASANYRLRGAQNLLRRFYLETRGDIAETVYGYGR
jgi:xanthine dehydrogenase small subunit